jgi:hypothetical protein
MTEQIIDYALPCMKAEQALKDAHNAFLEHKLDLALTRTMDAIVDARLMYAALLYAKEIDKRMMYATLGHAKETSTVYTKDEHA